ncbi:MAG TPA: GntR family transcriptional regulator [Acidimicrobiales bacterium]|nr:GntR family transcriptional regulator [Acidimicrobiales bacterium]
MSGLEHISLPDALCATLRRRILNAEIPAGARLVETQIAEEFEVSRTTVREALRTLESEGLVELAPRRHCVVTRMDEGTARDVLFARCSLEVAAAREWAEHPPEDLEGELAGALEAMEKAAASADMLAAVEADTLFHGRLVAAGGRPRLEQLWHILDSQMGALMRSELERQHVDMHHLATLHLDLVRALSSRDAEQIAAALHEHYLGKPAGALVAGGRSPTAPRTRRQRAPSTPPEQDGPRGDGERDGDGAAPLSPRRSRARRGTR